MVLSGSTTIVLNGRPTRVLSSRFNKALKRVSNLTVLDPQGARIVPSKGLSWSAVAASIRAGKKVQARVEGK